MTQGEPKKGLVFPENMCIKVILVQETPGLVEQVIAHFKQAFPAMHSRDITRKESRESKYLSLGFQVLAQSQHQLDAIYQQVSTLSGVVWML